MGVVLLQSTDSEEDLIVKPVSLGNVSIARCLSEYRGTNIRTIEQAELAIIVSRVHFKVCAGFLPLCFIITLF